MFLNNLTLEKFEIEQPRSFGKSGLQSKALWSMKGLIFVLVKRKYHSKE
jgi:hypothetical protein